jgi:hypothetical protein
MIGAVPILTSTRRAGVTGSECKKDFLPETVAVTIWPCAGPPPAIQWALQVAHGPQEQLSMENTQVSVANIGGFDEVQTSPASDVTTWMISELERNGTLSQRCAALAIKCRFGDQFVNLKGNGKLAINREVNALFSRQTRECVVWVRRHRMWRWRRSGDKPSRQQ